MLEVKKCGKNNYGFWAYGTLKYNGLEIKDIYTVNKELEAGKSYKPNNIVCYRTKKDNLRFRIEL